MTPLISVIIVNYNAGHELAGCVRSLTGADDELEIIIVDNRSDDDSLAHLEEVCRTENIPVPRIVRNETNRGFAVACNQGAEVAVAEYLLFLNPDCLVEPATISTLLQALRSEPGAGMAGGLILNEDGSEQRGCRRGIPTPWTSLVSSFGLKHLARLNGKMFADFRLDREPLPDGPVGVEAISGACMLVKRRAIEDVGPMDEDYFLHCEDLDWCMRFGRRGWKILFVPGARLLHHKGICSTGRPVFVEWSKHKGMVRFYRKFFAGQYPAPMLWLVWLGIWTRFGLSVGQVFFRKVFGIGRGDA